MSAMDSLFGIKKDRSSLFNSFERDSLDDLSSDQIAKNRESLYDLFSHKNWDSLSLEDKKSAVQALENDFAYQQGRPAKQVLFEPLDDGRYGGWNQGLDRIRLNENLLTHGNLYNADGIDPMPDANMQIFDTIAHEGYHAYQSYALKYPFVHDDKAQLREWALNEGKYFRSGDEYLIQPQERDAWAFGHDQTLKAFEGIQERCGPEPGWDEYEASSQISSYDLALERAQHEDPEVLDRMEKEMEAGCREKGIFYDHDPDHKAEEDASLTSGGSPPGEEPSSRENVHTEAPGERGPSEDAPEGGYRNLDIDGVSMDDIAPANAEETPHEEGDLSETRRKDPDPREDEAVSMDDISRNEALNMSGNGEPAFDTDELKKDNGENVSPGSPREKEPSVDEGPEHEAPEAGPDEGSKVPSNESEERPDAREGDGNGEKDQHGAAPAEENQDTAQEAKQDAGARQDDGTPEEHDENTSPLKEETAAPAEEGPLDGRESSSESEDKATPGEENARDENPVPSEDKGPLPEEDSGVSMDDISRGREGSVPSQESPAPSQEAGEPSSAGNDEDKKNDQSYGC